MLEQRQEVPYDQDEDQPWWDGDEQEEQDEAEYGEGELRRVTRAPPAEPTGN